MEFIISVHPETQIIPLPLDGGRCEKIKQFPLSLDGEGRARVKN